MESCIFYTPAARWEEGCLLGNGTIGAVVQGQVYEERILLNHEQLFAPVYGREKALELKYRLPEIRQLIGEGKYKEAGEIPWKLFLQQHSEKLWTNPFVPACDLVIRLEDRRPFESYRRNMNFYTGVADYSFVVAENAYSRVALASREYQALFVELNAAPRCAHRISLEKHSGDENNLIRESIRITDSTIIFEGVFTNTNQSYTVQAKVQAEKTQLLADSLIVFGDAFLCVTILPHATLNDLPEIKPHVSFVPTNMQTVQQLGTVIHNQRMNKISLSLHGSSQTQLLCNIFDAGRYEILSSCGQLPPNLQGIWNPMYAPPWCSDYTQNGNVQTAILGLMPCGDFESICSYFDYQEALMDDYRLNSKRLYGCRGIHIPSRTSNHGNDVHFDETWPMIFWTAGAGWAARIFYDYWLYTGDKTFFLQRALPFMKEAALFYEDFLFEGKDGKWIFSPGYSPENTPLNSNSSVCENATMDLSVAKELFTNLVVACSTLGISSEAENVDKWKKFLDKMPTYQINELGALKEWCTPELEDNADHRHCSHLYLLFYDIPYELRTDQALYDACKKAYSIKIASLEKEKGVMAFGLIQVGMVAAHLGDSDMVDHIVRTLSQNNYYVNFASSHNGGPVLFNADISGGMPALMLESLAQSFPVFDENYVITHYEIRLLPAVPKVMESGKVRNLHLKGGFSITMEWNNGKVLSYQIESSLGNLYILGNTD